MDTSLEYSELGTFLGVAAVGMAGVGIVASCVTVGYFLWKACKSELNCSKLFLKSSKEALNPACLDTGHPYQPCYSMTKVV